MTGVGQTQTQPGTNISRVEVLEKGVLAKGEDQSWLLECTHHASDRQVGSRCNADKWIPDGQYWHKSSKMDRIRNDKGKISKHGDTL